LVLTKFVQIGPWKKNDFDVLFYGWVSRFIYTD